jgi:hypothetical protein
MTTAVEHVSRARTEVDPRGLRFAAAVTTVVLAAVLLTESAVLLGVQAAIFAIAAFAGVRRSPYSLFFATVIRPRLASPHETEDPRPPQFAQGVGLVFALVGLVGLVSGLTTLGLVAVGFALAAAFLNAAFGFCLGCEVYLFIIRFFPTRARAGTTTPEVSA